MTNSFRTVVIVVILSISIAPLNGASAALLNISWSQLNIERTDILSMSVIEWSPVGNQIAFDNVRSKQISAVNWQTGEIEWRISIPDQLPDRGLSAFHWSPNGNFIAVVADGKVYVIDIQSGHPSENGISVFEREEHTYQNVRWNSDSTSLAAIDGDGYIDIFSLESGEITQTIDFALEMRGEGIVYQIFDWSPNGSFFASPYYPNSMAPLIMGFWDKNGHQINEYSNDSPPDSSSDLACSVYADGLIQVNDVQWANDSRTVAVAGSDGYGICRLNIDGTVTNHQVSEIGAGVTNLRWSPDQRWLAAAHEINFGRESICRVLISDVANNYETSEEQIASESCYVGAITWSPDSQHLAASTDSGFWIGTLTSS